MRKTRVAFVPVACEQHSKGADALGRNPTVDLEMVEKSYQFLLNEGYEVDYDRGLEIVDTYEKSWEAEHYFPPNFLSRLI